MIRMPCCLSLARGGVYRLPAPSRESPPSVGTLAAAGSRASGPCRRPRPIEPRPLYRRGTRRRRLKAPASCSLTRARRISFAARPTRGGRGRRSSRTVSPARGSGCRPSRLLPLRPGLKMSAFSRLAHEPTARKQGTRGRHLRMRMQSRSQNWSLIRQWVGNSALQEWHTRRSLGRRGPVACKVQ